jgi:hypothetical protein
MKKSLLLHTSLAGLLLLASCADEFKSDFKTDEPSDVALTEYVNGFDVLKSYSGKMHLSAEVPMSTLTTHSTPYSQLLTNFTEVTPTDAFSHAVTVSSNGVVDTTRATDAVAEAANASLNVMGTALCSPFSTQKAYMDKVVADTYVPGQRTNGDFKILDMDNLALGTKVEGSGKTYAEVVEDPLNEKGHVLHYTSAFNHPFVDITLPTGVTLGDLLEGQCDYMLKSTGWVPASVVKVMVDGATIEGSTKKAVDQGIEKGKWGTYKFSFKDIQDKLTDAQKAATSFRLGLGDVCSNPNYYIGDITVTANYLAPGHYEERPIEEKKADATKALDNYVKTIMNSYGKDVKTWIIAADYLAGTKDNGTLLSSKEDAAHFYLNEYLGDDFVVDAAKIAKNYNSDAQLFYSDNDLESDATKLANLTKMLKQWNDNGAGLAGVNAEVHLKYNAATLKADKEGIDNMLKTLAATGLQVRLSGLDITAVDESGKSIDSKQLSEDDLQAMADYYDYVIKQYLTLIPEAQRYGLSFGSYNADGKHIGLWDSSFNRRVTYAGVAQGLQGK